ncbi:MAG: bifunctional phosphopantothenoylcysteine decarboxylase/phosphopantothenate--cysteine ligase CoaBC [Hyphomicrobiales bacterium]
MTDKKSILLIIGGGIAAYKCLELIRRLKEQNISVTPVLTKAGAEFVTPLSLATLAETEVHTDLFDLKNETEIGHIQLSRQADLVVVAPATADLMAKMANGLANDLASTLLLATDKDVLVAPAMNVRMWDHPATQRNIATLRQDGVLFVGPDDGDMACGETGPGRLSEPDQIVQAIQAALHVKKGPLSGKSVLITAGPTHEPIDPVRYIANRSSGKQGYALAEMAASLGADVTLISGPTKLSPPAGVRYIEIETAREMRDATLANLPADIAICAAAVADWRVKKSAGQKMKKSKDGLPVLDLAENPDILATLSDLKDNRPHLLIGFAAETETVIEHAKKKLKKKGCDWIVANDVSAEGNVFGNDETSIHIITKDSVESFEKVTKSEASQHVLLKAAETLK